MMVVTACTGSHRSDAWMLGNLTEHRADFERLVRMADDDYARARVIRIAFDFTRLEHNWAWPRAEADWGISKARWDEYRALFRKLQLPSGLERGGDRNEGVQLMVYGVGLAGEGREYGYLRSPTPPAQVNKPGKEEYTTRLFTDNWYRYEWVVY
jgi:hypothetical protein